MNSEFDRLTQPKELYLADEKGNVTEIRTIKCDPIIQGVKEKTETGGKSPHGRYLGSIDPLTAVNWSRECGAAIGTREFAEYAKKKLMSGDYAVYRADHQRTHYSAF